jgi:serine phosphatase RsbU (regulator of sigma subunit)
LTLEAGDTLVFFTDGVIEARRDRVMFGTEGVRAALSDGPAGAGPLAKAIEDAVLNHTGGVVSDDLAILVVQGLG